jgi:fatty-acyl-CoA synthase
MVRQADVQPDNKDATQGHAEQQVTPSVGPSVASLVPLSPTVFLERAASVFSERTAVVDGDHVYTYGQLGERTARLAGSLVDQGVRPGDRIAALCPNGHELLELHYGVPGAGAVLVPINIRLSPGEVEAILEHSGARLLVSTPEFDELATASAASTGTEIVWAGSNESDYERRLGAAKPLKATVADENALIAINYTSGSTGTPKGVMYSHRGAYLQALAMTCHLGLRPGSSYLWTLPMFHCNGWCLTWAVTAGAATHVCHRKIDPVAIWRTICDANITHLSAAPTVLLMIAEAADSAPNKRPSDAVQVSTGGAPPPPALLSRLERLGMQVTHLYGLTETYGPCVINQWQPEWSCLQEPERSRLNARQGIGNVVTASVDVVDGDGVPVPADGETIGEIVIRGNNVMVGYYRDGAATLNALSEGFLRTGDLGVRYPDGYIELKDRSKDIIVTGGENVSSVEIERILATHPRVLESAVVARPHPRWGEVPVALVTLRDADTVTADELIAFVRERTARYKAPKQVAFGELPKTSTGKIQKHVLRASIKQLFGEEPPL